MKTSWKRALVWSVIAAAFVGPGTVTTATRAGSEGKWLYLPYILVAIAAGYLLMEMAARLTLITRKPLGRIVYASFGSVTVYSLFIAVCL
ncbi:MAG: divalent metal cation transporter, partial [Bacteroidota bacterium]